MEILATEKTDKQPHIFQLFLLYFSTFGLFSSFFFYRSAKRFNEFSDVRLSPLAWFFAPLFPLVQWVAFPIYLQHLRAHEIAYEIKGWSNWQSFLWVIVTCVAVTIYNFLEIIEWPYWVFIVSALIWCVGLMFLHNRVEQLLAKANKEVNRRTFKGYTIVEWVIVVLGTPIVIGIFGVLLKDQFARLGLENLAPDSVYVDVENKFTLPINGEGWSQLDIGTYSDGSALLELGHDIEGMYFLVFENQKNENINALIEGRISELYDDYDISSCHQATEFVEDSYYLYSYLKCEGTELGDPVIATFTYMETETNIIQLYGYFSTSKLKFERARNIFEEMSKGLAPHAN